MDPLTAGLILLNTVAEIIKLAIESQPMETRAEYARMALNDYKESRRWIENLFKVKLPKETISVSTSQPFGPFRAFPPVKKKLGKK